MINKALVLDLVNERIDELANGLFVVELNISSSNVIHIELDKKEGNVSVQDCISVSRNVEHNLDREEQDFELHVSSAGLDKPFRVPEQFTKNVGRQVKVILNDGSKLEGKLIKADASVLTLETEKKVKIEGKKKKELVIEQTDYPMEQIKETKIVISFK